MVAAMAFMPLKPSVDTGAHRWACGGQGSGAVAGRGCDVLLRCRAEPLRRRSRTLGLVQGLAIVEAGVGPMASGSTIASP